MKLKKLLITVLLSTSLIGITYAKEKLSCIGDSWEYGVGAMSNSEESYWEDVIIDGEDLIVPKFGEYRLLGKKDGVRFWDIPTGDKKYSFAELDTNTGKFTASIKEYGTLKQMDSKCSKKVQNLNLN